VKANFRTARVALAVTFTCALLTLEAEANHLYRRVNLVSDQLGDARRVDADLVNPWGLTIRPGGRILVVNNGSGTAKFYAPRGTASKLVITIPGSPSGVVQNFGSDFVITDGVKSAVARAIFVTEDGFIAAWSPKLNSSNAIIVVDNSASNAVYKGVARGLVGRDEFLYLANFRGGFVEMYDSHFQFVRSFTDATIPAGYAPFNVRNIRSKLLVTYAKQLAPDNEDDESGAGNGFVDVFDFAGNFLRRFAEHGTLNSPWGIARAPFGFGRFSDAVLVGNFGDGRINAFDPDTREFLGQLRDLNGDVIEIDGLWGLAFGERLLAVFNPFFCCDITIPVLYFTAGPDDETHGLFGYIRPAISFFP
jgi:uncharacterized protein (TIGR03118 family)